MKYNLILLAIIVGSLCILSIPLASYGPPPGDGDVAENIKNIKFLTADKPLYIYTKSVAPEFEWFTYRRILPVIALSSWTAASGLEAEPIIELSNLLLFGCIFLLSYIIVKKLFKNRAVPLASAFFISFSSICAQLMWGYHLTLSGIILMLTIFYLLIRYYQEKKFIFLLCSAGVFILLALVHNMTVLYLTMVLVCFCILAAANKSIKIQWRHATYLIPLIIICLLIAWKLNLDYYLIRNLWSITFAQENPVGIPKASDYLSLGLPVIIFGAIGAVLCCHKPNNKKLFLLAWLSSNLLMTQSQNYGLTFYPTRYFFYLFIPLGITAAVGLVHVLKKVRKIENKKISLALVFMIILFVAIFSALPFISASRSIKSTASDSDFRAMIWLKENSKPEDIVISTANGGYWIPGVSERRTYTTVKIGKSGVENEYVWQILQTGKIDEAEKLTAEFVSKLKEETNIGNAYIYIKKGDPGSLWDYTSVHLSKFESSSKFEKVYSDESHVIYKYTAEKKQQTRQTANKVRVVIIAIDGVEVSKLAEANTPNIDALANKSLWAESIVIYPSISIPAMFSSITGAIPLYTNIWNDYLRSPRKSPARSIFDIANEEEIKTAAVLDEDALQIKFNQRSSINYLWPDTIRNEFNSTILINNAINILESHLDVQLMFVGELHEADAAGQKYGYDSDNYTQAIEFVDSEAGRLLDWLYSHDENNTYIFLMNDHGMDDKGHGHLAKKQTSQFIILYGPDVQRSRTEGATGLDIAPTVLGILGLPVKNYAIGTIKNWDTGIIAMFGKNLLSPESRVIALNSDDSLKTGISGKINGEYVSGVDNILLTNGEDILEFDSNGDISNFFAKNLGFLSDVRRVNFSTAQGSVAFEAETGKRARLIFYKNSSSYEIVEEFTGELGQSGFSAEYKINSTNEMQFCIYASPIYLAEPPSWWEKDYNGIYIDSRDKFKCTNSWEGGYNLNKSIKTEEEFFLSGLMSAGNCSEYEILGRALNIFSRYNITTSIRFDSDRQFRVNRTELGFNICTPVNEKFSINLDTTEQMNSYTHATYGR